MREIARTLHFPNVVLDAGERAQHRFRNHRLGGAIIRSVTGSDSPLYQQLDWRSQYLRAELPDELAEAKGDKDAGWLARNWSRAAIVAAPKQELSELEGATHSIPSEQAVAYVADGVPHVGTLPNSGPESLFHELHDEDWAVAMRLGKKALFATIGLWLESERMFLSVESPRIVTSPVLINSLPAGEYSNLRVT
jgi:hypothetical protein